MTTTRPSGPPVQRAVIPVYHRRPADDTARQKDQAEVDKFAQDSSLGPDAGTVRAEFATGGSIAALQAPERLIVTGHGNVGTLNGYSGAEIASGLKTRWGLSKPYNGEIVLSSCKAGDSTWFSSSLVAEVSDNLFGYQAVVAGMKGNVVAGGANSTAPGVDRSVGSDAALANYRALEQDYRDLVKRKDDEFKASEAWHADLSARILTLTLHDMEKRLAELPQEWLVVEVFNAVRGSKTKTEQLAEDIADQKRKIAADELTADAGRQRIAAKYQGAIDDILQRIDATGVPFGTAGVTVRHGPADRSTLSNHWIAFLQSEAGDGESGDAAGVGIV
ncbi:hypothetical protein ABE85_09085 [Mitsuaria sp. 7]|nr:hypothetical protein ABE85_09085 [Mitsuaria sp. 7]